MDFNTFFNRFGLDSSNFTNRSFESIKTESGFIYEVEETKRTKMCPHCNHTPMFVHDYRWSNVKLSSTLNLNETLRIRRIRYKCPKCGKSHTFELEGIQRYSQISNFVKRAIQKEFFEIQSFSTIAKRYGVSVTQVINIFDEYTKIVPRLELPEYLCIDEKHFEGDTGGKYCVVLSNFFTGEVVDVLPNRQMSFLDEYFSNINIFERNKVKVFISDMYDGYSRIKNKYFPKAKFVIDLFHVVKLLTVAVNKIRIRTYNQIAIDDTIERHFLKTNWKYFLMNERYISNKFFKTRKFQTEIEMGKIILNCLKLNMTLWDGYRILQDLLQYSNQTTFTDAANFIERIIHKLELTGEELYEKVAQSYRKWRVGIANGLAKNQTGKRFSNAIAENNNSHIQRVINVAYGYGNFERFRARIMLILTYKK